MKKLSQLCKMEIGSPQFRIKEVGEEGQTYIFYSQDHLMEDLYGSLSLVEEEKIIQTKDEVTTLEEGDLIFSLISGTASLVTEKHQGYLYTQNYVKLTPKKDLDTKYLVYLLNEDKSIKKQLWLGLQGSSVLKYSLGQIKDLWIPKLIHIDKQKLIGEVYFKQLYLESLKSKVAKEESALVLHKLQEANKNE